MNRGKSAGTARNVRLFGVRIENRFNAIAHDPVRRLIKVHAHSIARARHDHRCDRAPACCESDAGQCRIIINALRREIDRLMRGIDRFDRPCNRWRCDHHNSIPHHDWRENPGPHWSPDSGLSGEMFAQLASPDSHRKLYAAAALGQLPGSADSLASASQGADAALASSPASNATRPNPHLGSIIDLTA